MTSGTLGGGVDTESNYDRAVGLIYEAVLQPDALPDALAAMTSLLSGDTAHLVGWNRCSGQPSLSVSCGLAVGTGLDYAAHYAQIDPRRQLALTLAPGLLLACHEHFDARFVSGNEFYQDYLLPKVGIHYLLGAHDLLPDSQDLLLLGFQRYVGHGPFSAAESLLLQRLLPHFRRALGLLALRRQQEDLQPLAHSALALSPLAFFALSAEGALLHANARGENLLRSGRGLTLRNGLLHASSASHDAALRAAIPDLLKTGRPHHLNLNSAGGNALGGHCCLTLMVPPRSGCNGWLNGRVAMVALVAESSGGRLATARQLIALFGLTPAEARLVRALAQGESVEDYAVHQGLKLPTIRTQLRSALAKTGTTKQKDLVRLAMMVPAVRG